MKKIAMFLVVCLVLSIVPFGTVFSTEMGERNGFMLVPDSYGEIGISVDSIFTLNTPFEMDVLDVQKAISIDNQSEPTVLGSGTEFKIIPDDTLLYNTLYLFRLSIDGMDEITWAFQTAEKFHVVHSLPATESTDVPINSGIEIVFSHAGYEPIDEYFEIVPHVEGRFEYHKENAVFVPSSLEYETVYTVRLKNGVSLSEYSNICLAEDFEFVFETVSENDTDINGGSEKDTHHYINFNSSYLELGSEIPPMIGFYDFDRAEDEHESNITVSVYEVNREDVISSIEKAYCAGWARYNRVDTSGLNKVFTEKPEIYDNDEIRGAAKYMLLSRTLPEGFYVIEAQCGDFGSVQIIVQITDIAVQVVAANNKTLVWANYLETDAPVKGARVIEEKSGIEAKTNNDGIAELEINSTDFFENDSFEITASNGNKCYVFNSLRRYSNYGYYYNNSTNKYWSTLSLDRNLFKNDDTINFFGFIKNRYSDEKIDKLSVEVYQGWSYTNDPLTRQSVVVGSDDVYSGEITLPSLDVGNYFVAIKHNDMIVRTEYFSIKDFVKPPYKMEVNSDKKAIFLDEEVKFSIKSSFFEGTPVSNLPVTYSVNGYGLNDMSNIQEQTDINGEKIINVIPKISNNDIQSRINMNFSAEATLPEIGRVYGGKSVSVFVNDINVVAEATKKGTDANLSVKINDITLDRINNETAEGYYDYIGDPTQNKQVDVEIYRDYYEKIEDGDEYDFIKKETYKKYRYEHHTEVIDTFSVTTDQKGEATKEFTIPDKKDEWYYAKMSVIDNKGRKIEQKRYIGREFISYYGFDDRYYLDGDEECYGIGDNIELELKYGLDSVDVGKTLFVTLQNGIKTYNISDDNRYKSTFSEKDIPNIFVESYYFHDGRYQNSSMYRSYNMNKVLLFDYEQKELNISMTTDKETYSPGDECTIEISVVDRNENPVEAAVNLSIVDEAVFALSDYKPDILDSLYSMVYSGLRFSYNTHSQYKSASDIEGMGGPTGGSSSSGGGDSNNSDSVMAAESATETAETYFRKEFKDTAHFGIVSTDKNGKATYTFKLPDNITSWRVTMLGINSKFEAGKGIQNINVTQPMFINYTLNNTFLAGDTPYVGLSVYGTELNGNEEISVMISDADDIQKAKWTSVKPFERVNIPLEKMIDEGERELLISAYSNTNLSDGLVHKYRVLNSYQQIDEREYHELSTDTVFTVPDSGNVSITFTDKSKGEYLYALLGMRYVRGDRLENIVTRKEANKLIDEHFSDLSWDTEQSSFDKDLYQKSDGGLAFVPHGYSDTDVSARLVSYLIDEIDVAALADYFWDVYHSEMPGKVAALYGLAQLNEPVLIDLNNYAVLDNLSLRDLAYIGLSYAELGDYGKANDIYDTMVAPYLEKLEPYYRVNTGTDTDDMLKSTSVVNILATKLDKPEKDGLYSYCIEHSAEDVVVNLERLGHIKNNIDSKTSEKGEVHYILYGEANSFVLENGRCKTIKIPAQNISEFNITNVSGALGAVSSYKTPISGVLPSDDNITVKRRFYNTNDLENSATSFNQGDIVRVNLWIDYSDVALGGSYKVTDYLPSGLEYVPTSSKVEGKSDLYSRKTYQMCYATVEGQKVIFYDYNRQKNNGQLYYYYARVVNPGEFKAEGTTVQSVKSVSSMNTTDSDTIVINP